MSNITVSTWWHMYWWVTPHSFNDFRLENIVPTHLPLLIDFAHGSQSQRRSAIYAGDSILHKWVPSRHRCTEPKTPRPPVAFTTTRTIGQLHTIKITRPQPSNTCRCTLWSVWINLKVAHSKDRPASQICNSATIFGWILSRKPKVRAG